MTVLLDWLTREGHLLVAWWLWIALAGCAALPLCIRVLDGLPDRGYTMARAIGMLLVTWIFWLLGSYGFLDNSRGSIILCWILVLSIALALYFRRTESTGLRHWWSENRTLVIVAELLFASLFFGWALYRAHQNGLAGTEKPMELAFLSAAQRSASFPPDDPWMSGYSISYYYLGYIMSAVLAKLSGITSTIGFNLTNASLFALAGMGAFGVVYNLVQARAVDATSVIRNNRANLAPALATGLVATVMLVMMGNFQFALIEAPLQSRMAPPSYLEFWRTQKLADFDRASYMQESAANPLSDTSRWQHWWWFNASRVPTDYDLEDQLTGIQPIGEFPAFSFVLADNHPHVLALPFVVAAIGLMLNLVLSNRTLGGATTIVYGIVVGGLAFLNAWDAPTVLAGLIGAHILRRLLAGGHFRLSSVDWFESAKFGAKLVLIAACAYLPYWIGLRSQAGGLLPNLIHPSLSRHFFIMFGPLVIILVFYVLVEAWRARCARSFNWRFGLATGLILLGVLLFLMTVLSLALAIGSPGQQIVGNLQRPVGDSSDLLKMLIQRRLDYGLTSIILLAGIALILARLMPSKSLADRLGEVAVNWIKYPPSTGFAMLLIGMGLCLTLFCEFFYLKDNFFVRINTVFKLYYQTWTLWSIAAAYGVYTLLWDRTLPKPHAAVRIFLVSCIIISILAGMSYTIAAINHRARIETGRQFASDHNRVSPPDAWTNAIRHIHDGEHITPGTIVYSRVSLVDAVESDLIRASVSGIAVFDGLDTIIQAPLTLDGANGLLNGDDQQVIQCLQKTVGKQRAVVAEAVGEAYNIGFGRVGALTGMPVILGWENHQRQWRGATYGDIAGSRAADIRNLFTRLDLSEVKSIIERYQITHILYGSTERQVYGSAGEEKFLDNLPVPCQSGSSRVFYTGV